MSILRRTMSSSLLPLLFGSLAACGGKETTSITSPVPPSPNLEDVLQYIEGQMSSCSIPGGSIAVVVNGKLTDQAGFGVKDPVSGAPVTASSLFQVGGMSRVVLGAAVLASVEKGKLDLSHPITDYVPLWLASGFDPSTVPLGDFLLDTAGLPDLETQGLSCPVGSGALASWFQSDAEPLWTPPGAVWDYSRRSQAVSGWALGAAASQPFEDVVASRVFGPAGMTTATYDPSVVAASDHAMGHRIDSSGDSTTVTPGTYDCEAARPADGVYASAKDFAHLAETLIAGGGSMLSASSVAMMEKGQIPDYLYPGDEYSYGLYDHAGWGLNLLRASGSLNGYEASLWMVPSSGFAVVIMFDAENDARGCSTEDAAAFAMTTYLGLGTGRGPSWTTPPSTWTPLAGTYVDPYELGTIVVTVDGSNLTASTTRYGDIALTQTSATAFSGNFGDDGETVTFVPGGSSASGWFVTRIGVGKRQ
jgi:CubicO group peptidase (beta-lactamase class C family)